MLTNPNVGGVGQSEVLLVLQSRARLGYYVQVVAATAATQLALVLKKKQYERFRLGQDSRGARTASAAWPATMSELLPDARF